MAPGHRHLCPRLRRIQAGTAPAGPNPPSLTPARAADRQRTGIQPETKHDRLERSCRRAAQIAQICARRHAALSRQSTAQIGGFARACRLADSYGPLTVSPSDTAVDRRIRIGQDGGAVSAVVIDRSRTVLIERCRLIVR